MLVRRQDFDDTLKKLSAPGFYSVDTETTGLNAYLGDKLFSIIIADEEQTYYFNFQKYDGLADDWVLPRTWCAKLQRVFAEPGSVWCMHNAKFDMSMLLREGLAVSGAVHCTESAARLCKNNLLSYSLGDCVARIGLRKDDSVDEYVKMHKLWTQVGKGAKGKRKHYDKVPFEIMSRYGQTDARVTHHLGKWQREKLEDMAKGEAPNILRVLANEMQLTKTCFEMEQVGIKIDRAYCIEALNHEVMLADAASREFREVSGLALVDSGKALAEAFTKMGEAFPRTAKGNPSFTDDILEGFKTPLARILQRYRAASKKANTYYRNFLDFADTEDRVHANMRQAGTATGRFSYSDPNLQNLNKEEDQTQRYIVRRSFIPTDSTWCLVAVDYEQMEYRVMLEYAKELGVIRQVLDGLDVHQATANMMGRGITRQQAKTINFMLLYGGGVGKLADSLGITDDEARELKALYFQQLPGVSAWARSIVRTVDQRTNQKKGSAGYALNWFGRRVEFDEGFAYTAPNHIIQGGCADVVKIAMNELARFLSGLRSRMLVQVHDEVLFEVHETELDIIPELRRIMEVAFPARKLPLVCSVDHSWKSWGDKVKGPPTLASRDAVQKPH